ncbi:type II toxin-antitoxin system VapC family toxin [Thauera sp.]|uniref:type II toxin-antitoxin system VapC family toxin n=1 Tax=Thauera sp. TaxID=1905334 RepID=UPI002C5E7F9E|nr:type II toxin-antitoxin system VapC family toxin [Thauera sp.]HRP22974.1 type II toxin-antitoxin system VapC family toxin [Thauera sp.]
MIYLLDTNILIYLIKNQPSGIAQRIDALPETDTLCMSFVTWAELLKGAERSPRRTEVLRRLNALARQVPVCYPADPAICRHYAEQATRLREAGTPIGANELWIACHALAEDATLVTHNTREFRRIAALRIEDWVSSERTEEAHPGTPSTP